MTQDEMFQAFQAFLTAAATTADTIPAGLHRTDAIDTSKYVGTTDRPRCKGWKQAKDDDIQKTLDRAWLRLVEEDLPAIFAQYVTERDRRFFDAGFLLSMGAAAARLTAVLDKHEPPYGPRCAVCDGPMAASAGTIALAGYSFTLPECEACASSGSADIDELKEAALRIFAGAHPECRAEHGDVTGFPRNCG